MKLNIFFALFLSIFCSLFSIIKISAFNSPTSGTLYVVESGDDTNSCISSDYPCATIQGAINKASENDTVFVATGIFTSASEYVVLIDKSIILSGGWNPTFTSQDERSTIDGENSRAGIRINNGVNAEISHFIIQNGQETENGGGINNEGNLIIKYCTIRNNTGGGIYNNSTLTIEWSTINNNTRWGGGGGVHGLSGEFTTINNCLIYDNQATYGGGIYIGNGNLFVNNSTINNNKTEFGTSNSSGGGIYYDGDWTYQALINNSTITDNEGSDYGGGITYNNIYGGEMILKNSIVANNHANSAVDCSGTIQSAGYNLIGNTAGCSFNLSTGDQLGVDPILGPLQDNGGPTWTQWLIQGSPAIDSGDPNGCTNHSGITLTTDQRGYSRPLDGDSDGGNRCDIGAFEADPNNLPPPPPETQWYVTTNGKDSYDCHSPSTACRSINGAINKAAAGDNIYISTDKYSSGAGNEVVLINKNINLSGGWNSDFTNQIGYTEIDGKSLRRGLTINSSTTARIERFNINHGFSKDAYGGGIYIYWRSNVVINRSIIQNNVAGEIYPNPSIYQKGGGIGMNNFGTLNLTNSVIQNNQAFGTGGGIFTGESNVTIKNCIFSNNTAQEGGGIHQGIGGSVTINKSKIENNSSTGTSGGGGGIRSENILKIYDSTITGNYSYSVGGGITGSEYYIHNSFINNNQAAEGGGIYQWYKGNIQNSSIMYNKAIQGNGGGIYNSGELLLTNVTIAYNIATTPSQYEASGGGIFGSAIYADNVTIIRNQADDYGGGISGYMSLRNSILAGNTANASPDCRYSYASQGYNIIGSLSGCIFTPVAGDLVNIDPKIDREYWWPTTFILKMDSPAIDGGDPTSCPDEDQIGTARPKDGNSDGFTICDIGAYEYDPDHPPRWTFLFMIIK
jgi:hypothetical protein